MYYTRFKTALCEIILVGNEAGLQHLHLNTGQGKRQFTIADHWKRDAVFFIDVQTQIQEYILGQRKQFNVLLNPQGSLFQLKTWKALLDIPYGTLQSYKVVAKRIGNPNASRAVGMANSKNPIPIIIPCHRVIGSNGKLTGFAHGLKIKQQLINLEKFNLMHG